MHLTMPTPTGSLFDSHISYRSVFNDTIFLLVSDHGLHFGEHLESLEGQVEHKLPMSYVIIPKWWSEMYPREGIDSTAFHNPQPLH